MPWKKKAGFKLLSSTVNLLSGAHIVSDLIALMDGEVPMDTYYALQDAEKKVVEVMVSVFDVKILQLQLLFFRLGR